jgi:hypothetical protein
MRLSPHPPRRPGRPPLPPRRRRTRRLFVRLTPDELRDLRLRAAHARLPVATYLRHTALHRRPPHPVPALTVRTLGELARWGNNLNQLTKLAHLRQLPGDPAAALRTLAGHLRDLRRRLAGLAGLAGHAAPLDPGTAPEPEDRP